MNSAHQFRLQTRSGGFSLIEVLVSIVILAIGLLGLAGLQTKANEIEMEAYQRSMALMLVRDMANRIAASRQYITDFNKASLNVYGYSTTTGGTEENCAGKTAAAYQLCVWGNAMKGVAEKKSAGSIGAPIGMRGCIISVALPSEDALAEFFVVGVWQGLTPTASPAAGTPGAQCAPDVDFGTGMRRAVVTRVLIPRLAAS